MKSRNLFIKQMNLRNENDGVSLLFFFFSFIYPKILAEEGSNPERPKGANKKTKYQKYK